MIQFWVQTSLECDILMMLNFKKILMKISENLRQFNNEAVLFAVTGDFEADFYLAKDGEIDKVDSLLVERRNPEIPEGFVAKESGNIKNIKKFRHAEFAKEFKKHLTALLAKSAVKEAYLFAPAELKNELEKDFPAKLRKSLKVYEGNFHKEHPFKLLEKVASLPK